MKAAWLWARVLVPGLIAGLSVAAGVVIVAAQLNTTLPAKQPVAGDCRPSAHLTKDGTLEFTDCSGSKPRVEKGVVAKAGKQASGSGAVVEGEAASPQLDPQTNARYQESLRASYDFRIYSYTQAKRTFDWQYWSSKVIFWVVLLLVGAGLAFSALQFYLGYRAGTAKVEESTFEATLQGVKVSSSVLGVIVLTISIVFFYLYLKYVYPITNVGP